MSRRDAIGPMGERPIDQAIPDRRGAEAAAGGAAAAPEPEAEPQPEPCNVALYMYTTRPERRWLDARLRRERRTPGQERLSMGEMIRRMLREAREREDVSL